MTSSATATESPDSDSSDERSDPVAAASLPPVSRSPGVGMGLDADADPFPPSVASEVEPEDPQAKHELPPIFSRSGAVDINYDLNYTKSTSPRTAARISWSYPQGGRLGASPRFWSRGRIYKCPPPKLLGPICAVYSIFSLIS